MFKIEIIEKDIGGGSIPVTWCLDKETIDKLTTDPQIVIVVAPTENYHLRKESRVVVGVRDLIAYLPFKTSGKNKIWAFISQKDEKVAKGRYLGKEDGEYISTILEGDAERGVSWAYHFQKPIWNGTEYRGLQYEPNISSMLEVDIPNEAFAKVPPAWEQKWVNHFFSSKPIDQCDYRRRRMFAYTLQPVIMMLQMCYRLLITLIALSIGSRNFSFKPLFHPLTQNLSTVHNILSGGSIFIKNVPAPKGLFNDPNPFSWKMMSYLLNCGRYILFMPLVIGVLTSLFLLVDYRFVLGILLGSVALITIFGMLCMLVPTIVHAKIWNKFKTEDDDDDDDDWKKEMSLLICSETQSHLTFRTLPAKKKTIKLHYQNLKNKVCRPFSA